MIPITQTKFGVGGNCLAACVASIFARPLIEIPDFSGVAWLNTLRVWADHEKRPLVVSAGEFPCYGSGVAIGIGPRGLHHAVVWYAGQMIHDPHPEKNGLVSAPNQFLYFTPF